MSAWHPLKLTLTLPVAMVLFACSSAPQNQAPKLSLDTGRSLTADSYLYEFPTWSPDAKSIAVWRNTSNQLELGPDGEAWDLVILNVSSGEIVELLGPGETSYPTWSPSGNELAAIMYQTGEEGTDSLTIFSSEGEELRNLGCSNCSWPIWLSEGEIIVAANLGLDANGEAQYGTARINAISGEISEERPFTGIDAGLRAVSPSGNLIRLAGPFVATQDGTTLLMTARDPTCSGIWSYPIGSDGPAPLIDSPEILECDPALSDNDAVLAYTVTPLSSQALRPSSLLLARAADPVPTALLELGPDIHQIRHPAWSPDGTQIAFVYGKFSTTSPAYSTLYIIDVPPELQP
ncbi:MAG: hypothetical protein ACC700_13960 [Anaerolineales bacterium]